MCLGVTKMYIFQWGCMVPAMGRPSVCDRQGNIVTTTAQSTQRRRALRKSSGAGVLRLELKDRNGNSRWITADVIDTSEGGVGICLATPISPGVKLIARGNFGGERGSSEVRAEVKYCCERSNGTFRAGLEFLVPEAAGPSQQENTSNAGSAPPAASETSDYYEMLELSPNANVETVNRVYRILAQRYHPDNTATGNSELFVRLCNAYRVLSDPEQRAKYDATRSSTRKLQWKIFDQTRLAAGPEAEKRKRQGILGLLYAKTLHDPDHATMTTLDFEELLGCPREHMQAALWYLKGKGFVVRGDSGRFHLTVTGMDEYEAHASPRDAGDHRLLEAGTASTYCAERPLN